MPESDPTRAHTSAELSSQSLSFVDRLFADYVANPKSVSGDWRRLFGELSGGTGRPTRSAATPLPPPELRDRDGEPIGGEQQAASRQAVVDLLVRNYRVRGHIAADLDPLGQRQGNAPELEPSYYGFTEADYDRVFVTRSSKGARQRTLREILRWLRTTYCRAIGVQFMHIDDLVMREWLQERIEESENRIELSRQAQLRILERLTAATVFETFLDTKFTGAKSFSLAGAETLIPLLDLAIEQAGEEGVEEIVLAMAHRGRLNVLANVIGKRPREIFREFQDLDAQERTGPGDVKYHLGYSSDWTTASGRNVHLSLCFNPSHLEFVNPVASGRMRAKQDRYGDTQRRRGMVILMHGDASFIAQGVVQETLNLSELPGYRLGGTLHVVINNQIGFTTSPREARSGPYCTDVAKMLQIPIFHVNGEDPEAVAQAVRLALDFRKEFQRDAVIDMYCYRQRGHNEGDEPTFTQPRLYRSIDERAPIREGYLKRLLALGGVTRQEADKIEEKCRQRLNREFEAARREDFQLSNPTSTGFWAGYYGGPASKADEVETGVAREKLAELLERQARVPDGFQRHPKLNRAAAARREMAAGKRPLDWSAAEALALASLAAEGFRVRLSGQDTARGTFSQRHAVLHDVENGQSYTPLAHVADGQAPVEILNSPLSEAGALGFEYGYSLDYPDALVAWEAQFGDFANAAQVVIDQFIASAEAKWRRLSGLTLLLPHGYEGQGPEHSSARLERFLALAANDNIQVVYPSTPAQYFHCLRRQVIRRWRKPLVVMTPKSLLRHRDCVSSLDELTTGRFQGVLTDPTTAPEHENQRQDPKPSAAGSVLLCSGKIFYELQQHRRESGSHHPAIIRIEQLYPLPVAELRAALADVAAGVPIVWVQEEPQNMGAWRFLRACWDDHFDDRPLSCIARSPSASPATGSKTAHEREQKQLIERAMQLDETSRESGAGGAAVERSR